MRSAVTETHNYADHRQSLRRDFVYSCAYCTISEAEAQGIAFEIDHFRPPSFDPATASLYANLYYSCDKCNRRKSNFVPTPEQIQKGWDLIRIDLENPLDHLAEVPHSPTQVIGVTEKGHFNVRRLDLNRPALLTLRSLRHRISGATEGMAFLLAEIRRGSIDRVPPKQRTLLLGLRKQAVQLASEALQNEEDFIHECLQSPLLEASQARAQQLASVGALIPMTPGLAAVRKRRRRFGL